MTEMPKTKDAETALGTDRDSAVTLLTREVSHSLDFVGALFLDAQFTAPWTIRSRKRAEFALSVHPRAKRVIVFHVVLQGPLGVQIANGDTAQLQAGDVVIFPYADQHVMHGAKRLEPIPVETLLPPLPWDGPPSLRHGGGGEKTALACGYLFNADLHLHPIFSAMPKLMVVRSGDTSFSNWLITNLKFAMAEAIGRDWQASVLARKLPELLFLQCIARYARNDTGDGWAWLSAATDPVVGRALAIIHRDPGADWTLSALANRSGASRSVLGERFNRLLGVSPMHYVTHWRLQLAARVLRTTNKPLAEIAASVGYQSESGFSRAFSRRFGMAPGVVRTR